MESALAKKAWNAFTHACVLHVAIIETRGGNEQIIASHQMIRDAWQKLQTLIHACQLPPYNLTSETPWLVRSFVTGHEL